MKTKVYLKPNVVMEPLYQQWYAWPHLISPATAAMNVVDRHLKIMNSYIQSPQIHAAAVKNIKMKGGPFIDYGGKRVDEIKALRDRTLEEAASLIEFSESIKSLNELIRSEAVGQGMQALYDKIPENLKGFVELTYDLAGQPSYKLFESLLYNSPLYNESFQSISMWITDNDERPFVLSTPRLEDDKSINLQIPFRSPLIDKLSRMKRSPQYLEELIEQLNIPEDKLDLFRSFFTDEAPPTYDRYMGDKVRMRYFGHACVLIETRNVSILVDPVVSYYGYQQELDRFSDADLPDVIDYVLITHNHQDHILFETLLPLRHKIRNLVIPRAYNGLMQDPSLKLMFQRIGFDNIIELEDMETIHKADTIITGIPFIGEHCDLSINSKLCYHIRVEDFSLMFMADACNVEPNLYRQVKKQIGEIDVIMLGMECHGAPLSWLYGPLVAGELSREKDESRRLAGSDFEQARQIVDTFNPLEVYVYAMGMEPWLEYISSINYTPESHPIVQSNMLLEYCKGDKVAERLFGEKEILYSKTVKYELKVA